MTEFMFRSDSYLKSLDATVTEVTPEGGIGLGRSVAIGRDAERGVLFMASTQEHRPGSVQSGLAGAMPEPDGSTRPGARSSRCASHADRVDRMVLPAIDGSVCARCKPAAGLWRWRLQRRVDAPPGAASAAAEGRIDRSARAGCRSGGSRGLRLAGQRLGGSPRRKSAGRHWSARPAHPRGVVPGRLKSLRPRSWSRSRRWSWRSGS